MREMKNATPRAICYFHFPTIATILLDLTGIRQYWFMALILGQCFSQRFYAMILGSKPLRRGDFIPIWHAYSKQQVSPKLDVRRRGSDSRIETSP